MKRPRPALFLLLWLLPALLLPGLLLPSAPARAQVRLEPPDVQAFPNPTGSGARAAGMGNAFISIADDATAGSWNPAGLTQLERPEFSVAGESLSRANEWDFESNRFDYDYDPDGVWSHSLNFASITVPFRAWEKNIVASISLQQAYNFDNEYDFRYTATDAKLFRTLDFEREGALYTVSPAAAMRVTPRLSLGAAVNFWMDEFGRGRAWETRLDFAGNIEGVGDFRVRRRERYEDLFGVNFNLGVRYEATEHLTLGAVFRSPFEASVHRRSESRSTLAGEVLEGTVQQADGELDFPWTAGAGAAWRFNDFFTASLDVTRTDWEHFEYSDDNNNPNEVARHLVTGLPPDRVEVEPTWSVRAGAEYLFVGRQHVIPVRWGFAYDPQPGRRNPDTVWVASAGTGIVMGDRLSLDAAYQYRFGDVDAGAELGEIEVESHRVLVSVIVYW